jgi:hypothetical protein
MDLTKKFVFRNNILRGKVPTEILQEAKNMTKFCRQYKDSPLSELRYLDNIGKNTYQCYIPFSIVNESFMLPYLNVCGNSYLKHYDANDKRIVMLRLRNNDNNLISYDIWINYCNFGDQNKKHIHLDSNFAGILFVKNDNESTYFENGEVINGKKGDIVIFPSSLLHWTKPQKSKKERTTISFNFIALDN